MLEAIRYTHIHYFCNILTCGYTCIKPFVILNEKDALLNYGKNVMRNKYGRKIQAKHLLTNRGLYSGNA